METQEKNIIATLKAEFVNEFEFVPEKQKVSRFSDEMKVIAPYTSDFKATVAVKIGNAVKNLTFKENNKYISSQYLEDGTRKPSLDVYWLGIDKNTNPFEDLENMGIAVDYLEVLMQYQKLVEEAKHRKLLMERYEKWERIREAKKSLKESWIHDFEGIIKADKNKNIKAAVKETEFIPSKEWNKKHYVTIKYRGVAVPIHKIAGSFCFNNEKYEYDMKPFDVKTGNSAEISEGKLKRAKREGTLFLKAIEAIDERNAIIKSRIERRKNQVKETEEKRLFLEKVCGHHVHMEEKTEYPRRNSHRTQPYMFQTFWLITEQPESKYSSFKGIKIDYSDYNEKIRFSINGKFDLREDQFKKIIEILLDGRKPFTKVVKPKDEGED